MTQYNSVNMKLANLQLNKLKSAMKNSTVTLRFSSNILLVLMMKLVFHISYFLLVDKLRDFVSLFKIIRLLI